MRLVKDEASTAGRYVNGSWRDGEPGTFAVVIGVSAYAHLNGGTKPATETYGLGQLYVSALTAYDFFDWLAGEDRSAPEPAQCWLLLSPTDAERSSRSEVATTGGHATFENCRRAIREWSAAMQALSPGAAAASRSLFFFSGHGLEIHQHQQVLLPADYLEPVAGGVNDAISTLNLVNGVACLAVPHHTFFVDACRNDVASLREKRLEGAPILDEAISRRTNPSLIAPVLYASAPGTAAYQYRRTDGRSIYGTALLEGLRGREGISLDCDGQGCNVWMFNLQAMMKRRVEKLMAEASANTQPQSQRVLLGGCVDDLPVARVPARPEADIPAPSPPPAPPLGGMGYAEPAERSYELAEAGRPWHLASGDFNRGHDLFGSEQLTALFLERARVTPLPGGAASSLPDAGAVVTSVTRSQDTRSFTVALELPTNEHGWWLTVPSGEEGEVWAAVLPSDAGPVTYVLDVHTEHIEQGVIRPITRMDTALALTSGWPLAGAAAAWWAYDTQSTGAAARFVEEHDLLELLWEKVGSPLGATVAGYLLLEVRSHDIPEQWLRNLTAWFDRPDPPLLLAEHALRSGDDTEWIAALRIVTKRGLPHLAGNLGRLHAHLSELERRTDLPEAAVLHGRLAPPLAEALARLQPGGLFATFFGHEQELSSAFLGPFH